MKVIHVKDIVGSERDVYCPHGGFISRRMLLADDGMGFSLHHTTITSPEIQHWHYKNHLEACYCIAGGGNLVNLATGERHFIHEGMLYVLDNHDDHTFQTSWGCTLICIFNPPLKGDEIHKEDGSYEG
jgi:L-ectoine synthase